MPILILAVMAMVEILSHFYSFLIFQKALVLIWFFVLGSIYVSGLYLTALLIRKGNIGFLGMFLFVLFYLFQKTSLNGEAVLQATCNLSQFSLGGDYGINRTCFLGYPSRGYWPMSALSFLFHQRSWYLIQFSLYLFYLALGSFYFYKTSRWQSLFIGTPLMLSTFFMTNLTTFEQIAIPGVLAMGLSGVWRLLDEKNFEDQKLEWLFFSLLYYSFFSYTPCLSVGVFFLVRYFIKYVQKRQWAISFLFLLLFGSILVMSILNRQDIQRSVDHAWMPLSYLFASLKDWFLPMDAVRPGSLLLLAMVLLSFRQGSFFTWLWILVSVVSSILVHGYTNYTSSFIWFKSAFIFPVIFSQVDFKIHESFFKKWAMVALGIYALFFQIRVHELKKNSQISWYYWGSVTNRKMSHLIEFLKDIESSSSFMVIHDKSQLRNFGLGDWAPYFFPDRKIDFRDDCSQILTKQKDLVFIAHGDQCESEFLQASYKVIKSESALQTKAWVYPKTNEE